MTKTTELVQTFLNWEREDFAEGPKAFLVYKGLPYENEVKELIETHSEATLSLESFSNMGFLRRKLYLPTLSKQRLYIMLCPCGSNFRALITFGFDGEKVLRKGCDEFTYLY